MATAFPSSSPSSSPLPYLSAAAMAFSRSTARKHTEEMASPSAGRVAPASSRTPASATAKSGSLAAGTPRVGGAPGGTGASKAKGSTAAAPRAGGAATSAPATPAGATKSSGASSAAARGLANVTLPSWDSSAAWSEATQPSPHPRRCKSTAKSASASRASRAATRSADEDAAVPCTVTARVRLPPSRPGIPSETAVGAAAAPSDEGDAPMQQKCPPPVPRRGRLPVVEDVGPADPGLLSGGPPRRGRHSRGGRAVRRLPPRTFRTTQPWGRGRASAGGTSPRGAHTPWRPPTHVPWGRLGRPIGRR